LFIFQQAACIPGRYLGAGCRYAKLSRHTLISIEPDVTAFRDMFMYRVIAASVIAFYIYLPAAFCRNENSILLQARSKGFDFSPLLSPSSYPSVASFSLPLICQLPLSSLPFHSRPSFSLPSLYILLYHVIQLRGLGSAVSSSVGSGAKSRPQTHVCVF